MYLKTKIEFLEDLKEVLDKHQTKIDSYSDEITAFFDGKPFVVNLKTPITVDSLDEEILKIQNNP